MIENLGFESLPTAVTQLTKEVSDLKKLILERSQDQPSKKNEQLLILLDATSVICHPLIHRSEFSKVWVIMTQSEHSCLSPKWTACVKVKYPQKAKEKAKPKQPTENAFKSLSTIIEWMRLLIGMAFKLFGILSIVLTLLAGFMTNERVNPSRRLQGGLTMAAVSTYLNFSRNTEEAFNFYQSIVGGEFFGDIPPQEGMLPMAEEDKNLIMDIELKILGCHNLTGTDAPESKGFQLNFGNNAYINLQPDTRVETKRLFDGVSKGGK